MPMKAGGRRAEAEALLAPHVAGRSVEVGPGLSRRLVMRQAFLARLPRPASDDWRSHLARIMRSEQTDRSPGAHHRRQEMIGEWAARWNLDVPWVRELRELEVISARDLHEGAWRLLAMHQSEIISGGRPARAGGTWEPEKVHLAVLGHFGHTPEDLAGLWKSQRRLSEARRELADARAESLKRGLRAEILSLEKALEAAEGEARAIRSAIETTTRVLDLPKRPALRRGRRRKIPRS